MKAKARSLPAALLLLLPLLLYGAALNPYFPPGTYDDVIFYYGARSLVESGSFQFAGKYVVDWAPGLSVLLALPLWLGFGSIWVAKLCILLCVGTGLWLAFRYLQAEGRPRPLFTCALFALLPTGFMMGTRLVSEWPFIALSFLFLGLLNSLAGQRRGLPLAALAGLVLGAASLTRWIGVLLGAALLSQALSRRKAERARGFRCVLPEFTAAAIGAALFCLWKLKIAWQISSGAAEPSTYYPDYWYLAIFTGSNFSSLPSRIGDLFFQLSSLSRYLGIDGPALRMAVWMGPGLLTFWGMALHFWRQNARPGDWYALVTLVLFALLKHNPQVRYLLPIAPFLLSYFLVGLDAALAAPASLTLRWRTGLDETALAAWTAALVVLDGCLLLRGNVTGSHNGLCVLVSPDADAFYREQWRDLYRAGQFIAASPAAAAVSVTGQQDKYMLAFSGHNSTVFPPERRVDFVVEIAPDQLPDSAKQSMGLQEAGRFGTVVVYRAARSPISGTGDPEIASFIEATGLSAFKKPGKEDP